MKSYTIGKFLITAEEAAAMSQFLPMDIWGMCGDIYEECMRMEESKKRKADGLWMLYHAMTAAYTVGYVQAIRERRQEDHMRRRA